MKNKYLLAALAFLTITHAAIADLLKIKNETSLPILIHKTWNTQKTDIEVLPAHTEKRYNSWGTKIRQITWLESDYFNRDKWTLYKLPVQVPTINPFNSFDIRTRGSYYFSFLTNKGSGHAQGTKLPDTDNTYINRFILGR